ncbi:serine-pyruvate aminotransferase and/or alanine glyoxylate transaminase [Micromonas pusilla CCMP1545]|uniref:alanine--glyoxylate transaminase n=1 Tax=Micromonas pusilla (strain CCMP1545) TaxID=564608 RepID=C1N8Y2_MICPC|nr:serine-pyruvate aminotransferase and/or alanine glyoxylate transaminase [Micromonas pusilla CCMP1545]EEH51426.1 serine-pyruvate aminotransferase and/or alanine glyoxylate transaminase [Micromonas pusilla CCMP1545]|eukprot:XP_003064521.1 serine-pyruvate aminotransferase and/or alanine glyoxylate transaminase [Micromonas pusilla CCMP1545]
MKCPHDPSKPFHKSPLPLDHAGGLLEYSVVYTDRAMNHMSAPFCKIMNDIDATMKEAYNCSATIVMPGSGSYGMEAVARQWATNKKVLVLRNGYFSYRWTDIFEQTGIPSETIVLKGQPADNSSNPQFMPHDIEEVCAAIAREKPAVVFAPHVETSTGIILPDEYISRVSRAVHDVGGLFVLDCIASGTVWVDMKATGVDAILSAPQKGWTGPACSSLMMLSERGEHATRNTTSTSMVINMRKWLEIMDSYTNGGFAYYTTMPTDALGLFRDAALETKEIGFAKTKRMAWDLGDECRDMMKSKGLKTVSADGYEAPGVSVWYTPEPDMFNKFKKEGFQIAAGVPFMINEPPGNFTFRIGLFGLDKICNKDNTIKTLEGTLEKILASSAGGAKAAAA